MTKWYQTQAKSDVKCVDKIATNGDQIYHEKHRQIDKFLSVKFKFIYIYTLTEVDIIRIFYLYAEYANNINNMLSTFL